MIGKERSSAIAAASHERRAGRSRDHCGSRRWPRRARSTSESSVPSAERPSSEYDNTRVLLGDELTAAGLHGLVLGDVKGTSPPTRSGGATVDAGTINRSCGNHRRICAEIDVGSHCVWTIGDGVFARAKEIEHCTLIHRTARSVPPEGQSGTVASSLFHALERMTHQ